MSFREVKSTYIEQRTGKVLKQIKKEGNILAKSDKIKNYYLLEPEEYYRFLNREGHREYISDPHNRVERKINGNTLEIAPRIELSYRLEVLGKI